MAFVLLHPQHAAKWAGRHQEFGNDLKNHAKARLPGFACPEWIEVVPELPVSPLFIKVIIYVIKKFYFVENFHREDSQKRASKDSCKALIYTYTYIYIVIILSRYKPNPVGNK